MDKKLLNCLVCPQTGAALHWMEAQSELWCPASGLAYPVKDGVAMMLVAKARCLSVEEIQQCRSPDV